MARSFLQRFPTWGAVSKGENANYVELAAQFPEKKFPGSLHQLTSNCEVFLAAEQITCKDIVNCKTWPS